MVFEVPPLHGMDKWLRSAETVTDAPAHKLASYMQVNVPLMGLVLLEPIGMSMGAVALHDVMMM
jgi:hypothetical protein